MSDRKTLTPEERLRHVNLKVQRAKEHIAALARTVLDYFATEPYTVACKIDQERRPVYYVSGVREPPESIPLILGDAIQNLMGALDHLAYQLVCHDTGDKPPQPGRIYFPIADDLADYDARKRNKMQGARPETIAAIDALKPYRAGNFKLWSLHKLNNIEKHRILLTVGSAAYGIHLGDILAHDIRDRYGAEMADHVAKSTSSFLMPADKGFPLTPGFELFIGMPGQVPDRPMRFNFSVLLNEADIAPGIPIATITEDLARAVDVAVEALTPLLT